MSSIVVRIAVRGYPVGKHLAVHKTPGHPCWTVTHRPTGFGIVVGIQTCKRAMRVAKRIRDEVPAEGLNSEDIRAVTKAIQAQGLTPYLRGLGVVG